MLEKINLTLNLYFTTGDHPDGLRREQGGGGCQVPEGDGP